MRHAIPLSLCSLLVTAAPAYADALGCATSPPPSPGAAEQLARNAHGETLAGALVLPGSLLFAGASVGMFVGGFHVLGPHDARDDAAITFSILTAGASLTTLVYGVALLERGACDRRRGRLPATDGSASGAALLRIRF